MMGTAVTELLDCIRPIVESGGHFDLFQAAIEGLIQENPENLSSYELAHRTVRKLSDDGKLGKGMETRLDLAIQVAQLSGNNPKLVASIDRSSTVNTVRDFAVHMDTAAIESVFRNPDASSSSPPSVVTPGTGEESTPDPASDVLEAAKATRAAAFAAAPTAAVQGMVMKDKVKLSSPDPSVKDDVVRVLSSLGDDAIVTKAVSAMAETAEVPPQRRPAVAEELKQLGRLASMSSSPRVMEALAEKNFTSASAIVANPKSTFVASMQGSLTAVEATEVFESAANTKIRNENVLVGLLQLVRGTGLEAIDGMASPAFRQLKVQKAFKEWSPRDDDVNFETLFGGMDQCDCDDCTTVYSAASYFVDLLEYLRHSDVAENAGHALAIADSSKEGEEPSIAGTVLEKLFRRRPDLGNLQLTCENTNTILPYIDLGNEVMESFILSLDTFKKDSSQGWAKQVRIDVYNVGDEDSGELLSQPQNTNYDAYRVLADASYPLTLPYHQPIDAQRAFLGFLKVPRLELLDAFRPKPPKVTSYVLTEDQQAILASLQQTVLNRQVDAEILGLVQEEYRMLTGEVFFEQEFFKITENKAFTADEYKQEIGLLPPYAYWGYQSEAALVGAADDPSGGRTGLSFVKAQFLPRSGVSYMDLCSIVETAFINPMMPKGEDKRFFDSLRFSYKFLQTLVNHRAKDSRSRFKQLSEFLVRTTNILQLTEQHVDETSGVTDAKTASSQGMPNYVSPNEAREWVYNNFEKFGKIIVLDSGEGPRLPSAITGQLVARKPVAALGASPTGEAGPGDGEVVIGTLATDGTIKNADGVTVANVTIGGRVLMGSAVDEITMSEQYRNYEIDIRRQDGQAVAAVDSRGYLMVASNDGLTASGIISGPISPGFSALTSIVEWYLPAGLGGSCNIDNVRLIHLDGTSLSMEEWHRFQQFIRLWRRLAWSIPETDMALTPVAKPAALPGSAPVKPEEKAKDCYCAAGHESGLGRYSDVITFDNFTPESNPQPSGTIVSRPSGPTVTVETLHRLATIKKLVALTDLSVEKLLVFWNDIPTKGPKSLYTRLFFTSNIRSSDPVFGPDRNGDYFIGSTATMTDHILIVSAAFGIKPADVNFLLGGLEAADHVPMPAAVPNVLNIENLSAIYRHVLLARVLGVKVVDLGKLGLGGFLNAFDDPRVCLDLMETWALLVDSGISLHQLWYVAGGGSNPSTRYLDTLAPDTKMVLQTAKTLHDGMVAIKKDHPVPQKEADATPDLVKTTLSLIYEETVIGKILQFLAGESVFTVRADPISSSVLGSELEKEVKKVSPRVSYVRDEKKGSKLSVSGILADEQIKDLADLLLPEFQTNWAVEKLSAENATAKQLKSVQDKAEVEKRKMYEDWKDSVMRMSRLPESEFRDIFPSAVVQAELVPKEAGTIHVLSPDDAENTAAPKRLYFLRRLIPFLQDRLARVLVEDTMASAVGFDDKSVARTVLNNIPIPLGDGQAGKPAMGVLLGNLRVEDTQPEASADPSHNTDVSNLWTGYLAPQTTEWYELSVAQEAKPSPMILDGKLYRFEKLQDDPERLWSIATERTPAIVLESGTLYPLELDGIAPGDLQWKTTTSSRVAIPESTFLPNRAEEQLNATFVSLQKLAIVCNGFKLSSGDILHIQSYPSSFAVGGTSFDFTTLTISMWKRLQSYVEFRDSLPEKTKLPLLDFFTWAEDHQDAGRDELVDKMVAVAGWDRQQVCDIFNHAGFTRGQVAEFRNEAIMSKFGRLVDMAAKIGVDIPRLFAWATPLGTASDDFFKLHEVAEDMKKMARSRYSLGTWPDAVKPINDKLRENQKMALIAYLLAQDEMLRLGIHDADGLFEYFLIDPQMTPLVETSRIKQAIATVQVYIQRCLLGLEESPERGGVPPGALDAKRWEWMQRYRVWEANRKVFLYPENWIDPSLRDDKSEFFQQLEAELLQKDLSRDVVSTAFKTFLYGVSDISNLTVAGLCFDRLKEDGDNTIHLFAKSRAAPYTYYHNTYRKSSSRWTNWKKMMVEIPQYTDEDYQGLSGSYIAPISFNNRLVVFIPQMLNKTIPKKEGTESTFTDLGGKTSKDVTPDTAWEIKMSWIELRNGTWTQRKLCSESIVTPDRSGTETLATPAISTYKFVTHEVFSGPKPRGNEWIDRAVSVEAVQEDTSLGTWTLAEDQLFLNRSKSTLPTFPKDRSSFGYDTSKAPYQMKFLHVYNDLAKGTLTSLPTYPYATSTDATKTQYGSRVWFSSNSTHSLQYSRIGQLMSRSAQATGNSTVDFFEYLGSFQQSGDLQTMYGGSSTAAGETWTFDELSQPFSLYNWELGLHAPMAVVDRLLKAQQFEEALNICHCVFNPMAGGKRGDMSRAWVFAPFRKMSTDTIESFFQSFSPNQPRTDVDAWRDNPFAPHVIARTRPVAYMKWIVMKYIEILIEWGDHYFRQNTLETIPNAIQMYILASHLYGPRGQKIKKPRKVKSYTYNSLMTKFDAFSNALVKMEDAFPTSNLTPLPVGKLPNDTEVELANVFGFAGTLFFSIPDNPQLRALGERIDDRLFKIRHSQDINGIFRKLPLFEPPIDPSLLVQAAAQGLSINSVLTDLNGPMPNYRFQYLLQRALELASEVKSFGHALLAAKERQDGEEYSALLAQHETGTRRLVMEMKKLAVQEANSSLEALVYSRKGPESRMRFYLQLAGEELSAVPGAEAEFQALSEKIQAPVDSGGLKLLPAEKLQSDLNAAAVGFTVAQSALESVSAVFKVLPETAAHGTPLGVGAAVKWGAPNIGDAMEMVAKGLHGVEKGLSYGANSAGSNAAARRALNDRLAQANMAGYEISSIDKQITAAKIRLDMANRDIELQQKQIDQAHEAEEFLRSKYTNSELYSWIFGQTKSLFYKSYTEAHDVARKVEKVFKFERPQVAATTYVKSGYWNTARDGLLAGEHLFGALKQIEAAYISNKGHDFEITKNVSLRHIDPFKLLALRETGSCGFSVPEILFDMDFPGHYLRRIKSVSVTIPCVVGPYSSVNATLRLDSSRYRVNSDVGDAYPEEQSDGSAADKRFATTNVPISSIAVSSGQGDSGVFELSFQGDRYVPFEGAGAVSSWTLSLPDPELASFNYASISDVILQIRYTSLDGGTQLRDKATEAAKNFVAVVEDASDAGGLHALFDLKNDFGSSWARFSQATTTTTTMTRELELPELQDKLPLFAHGRPKGSVKAHDVWLLIEPEGGLDAKNVRIMPRGENGRTEPEIPLTSADTDKTKGFRAFEAKNIEAPIQTWALMMQADGKVDVKRMWMLVRYVIKKN
ncbi:hypothetical protein MKZ38_003437 [Zalerion maritima]|uniref:Uncharacterized protein n=1 Tax=Zalerion maritima TaxID=339359 RepID=A0AAD5WSF0_9PEZI|nr:hypothetical protein MKZ38_003437 [Zalerion maritima]